MQTEAARGGGVFLMPALLVFGKAGHGVEAVGGEWRPKIRCFCAVALPWLGKVEIAHAKRC